MSFNSAVFLQFFAAFLLLYWLVRNHLHYRNILIVAASYLFYGWWDWRFLSLLLITSLLDFGIGLLLGKTEDPRRRKLILSASIVVNLTILGFFKYYDFFIDSMAVLLTKAGVSFHPRLLHIILPWGISFYTFQSMSYAIDVYRRELAPTRNLINFMAYVSFFPQLVAGPINRGRHLLPQFEQTRIITLPMIEEGIWLALWGMFKKVALADSLAPLVEMVFNRTSFTAPVVLLGTIAFGLQIYCDFSGYSDIARGTARILGFDIMVNFNVPYAATSLREFWQRWHISLSTWLRDYLYIPLGGNRLGLARTYLNLLITMFLGGLWHGAAWNFVLWGIWHGLGLAFARGFIGKNVASRIGRDGALRRPPEVAVVPTSPLNAETAGVRGRVPAFLSWLATMAFVFFGWMLFRAHSLPQIWSMTNALLNFSAPSWISTYAWDLLLLSLPLIALELWQVRTNDRLIVLKQRPWIRAALQAILLMGIVLFWEQPKMPFIYFQF